MSESQSTNTNQPLLPAPSPRDAAARELQKKVLPNQCGLETQHENLLCGDLATTCSRTNCNQVIINGKDTKTWTSCSLNSLECVLDADKSAVLNSSMSMATGASQHSHYPISKASVNHSSSMFSSQGGPNRGWASEGKSDLSVGTRGQSNWGTSNINLNPSANPAAWPILGHEGPGVGTRPGGMGGSSSVPSNICCPGGVAPIQGTNGNGNLVGDCAWGNPDTPELHQSPTRMNFSMEPPNLKTDGLNNKTESMSPADGWGRDMSQSPTEPATGDSTSRWGNGEMKSGESKDSGWDSGGISSWGPGGDDANWGHWNKQSSTEGTGWDANDGPTQESMNSWRTDAPGSEGSKDSSEGQRERSCSMDVPLLPRQDLDPRVLCNSGWGQTPVRQHTVWEMDENLSLKDDGGTETRGTSSNAPSMGSPPHAGCTNLNQNVPPRMESGSKTEGLSRVMSTPRWGGSSSPTNQASTRCGEPPANKKVSNGSVGSWGESMPDGPSASGPSSQLWGSEDKSSTWDDGPSQVKKPGGNGPSSSSGWGNCASGDWGEPSEGKVEGSRSSSWDGDGGSWKENQKSWGKPAPPGGENWRDSQRPNGPTQGWGGKNPQDAMGSWGGPNSVKQSGSSWRSTGRQDPGDEATGWEEPSPSSIRRKMEIDDGTATWGDPNSYRTCVNMWDKNNPSSQGNTATINNGGNTAPKHQSHGQPPNQAEGNNGSPNQLGPPHNRMQKMNPGWGEIPNIQPKSESWVEPDSSNPKVDNGTAAWGKSPKASGVWGENGHESSGSFSRGSGTSKPVPKSMQDTWGSGGEEISISSSQWDTEDGDMWTSPTSQDNTSSCSSWNQHKKAVQKVKIPSKQEEVWIMNRLIKQLTDMGFPRDPAEEALRSNNMNLDQAMSALLEKKSDGEKRGMRTLLCRPPNLSKDTPLDRNAFLDKDGGLSDDAPTSPFIHSPGHKLTNSHGMGGVSPGLMQNLNSRQMNGMFGSNGAAQSRAPPPQALNSGHHPPPRAQVPQFLSPQVQAQLLQFAAKNIGLNPALLTSPINPQQMTLLYQLQQLQMAYQRLQIQQQMMQAQRNASGPIRQQEQQVARTISNMQQQIQQHQRQLAQALLMKQQQQQHQASSSHTYPSLGKPNLDAFPGNSQASTGLSMSDLHTKEPHTSPSSFGPYPLSGLNGSVGVGCMDALKDAQPQPQSRLSQWTHTSSNDSISTTTSSSAPSSSHAANIKPVMEDSFSAYSLMSSCQSPSSPLGAPESWPPGKNTNEKMANGTNVNWPPEFCPGVPWKGLQNIDPESDPNVTPGSVSGCPTINTNIQDVNRYLLRDRNGGKLLDMKSTWSTGSVSHTPPSLSNDMWKIPVGGRSSGTVPRPPPGLTNNKHNWTPGPMSNSWSRDYTTESSGWNSESSSRTSSWLVLRNLTPQIDGSTLRTLCMQHGPLITFHLSLPQGNALVRYSSKEEAAKAQKSLHMCVLGNTTILAEFAGEEEVTRFFSQAQSFPPSGSSTHSALGQWGASTTKGGRNPGGGANTAGADLLWAGVQQPYSSLWGPINGEESRVMGSPVPVNTLLPGDLLSGENM